MRHQDTFTVQLDEAIQSSDGSDEWTSTLETLQSCMLDSGTGGRFRGVPLYITITEVCLGLRLPTTIRGDDAAAMSHVGQDQYWSTISILLSKASLRLQGKLDAPSSAPETVKVLKGMRLFVIKHVIILITPLYEVNDIQIVVHLEFSLKVVRLPPFA
ncbi:uncharacterized protein RSE6_11812 [Rhynchosporium secalis]|uniref:Uncharacterized protein n=1 Tax=Rhynchosporium secalis TaxID=38038 RepID=A0A1E1MPU1_RHYSE|nr:uncharacterized protein RSE6_11812 [Rhynchosporium secalis]